jgi:hypothetical protein
MSSNRWATTGESATRRVFGLALGALLGLVYGLTSQTINRIILPGIPLYQPPLGPAGNPLLIMLVGALLGLVAAWPTGSIAGTFAASTIAAGLLTFVSFLSVRLTEQNTAGMIVAATFVLLPLVGFMVPLLGFFRWVVNKEMEARREAASTWRRLRAPLALIAVFALIGALSLFSPEARQELLVMDRLLRDGLTVQSADALPAPLHAEDVEDFLGHAQRSYTLEWTQKNLNRFRIPRPGRNFDSHAVVLARFANGWQLACLFVAPAEPPECKSYGE